ncbi:Pheromone P-factor receptor [Teratosphaeria destructans]|uniref:Pheromone P-factor receptor n=1 Tax=Teratosphaeria destructans TaxID=418781 RepID=A0A9W7VZS1_9PEZI|nr:Pheromone P-factor receptor [Teratosphaeria destructans]
MADDSAYIANSTFDPYTQTFSLTLPDGKTPIAASMASLLQLNHLLGTTGIIFGVQIGMAGLLLIVLLLMTSREKRCSLIFILNTIALVLVLVRDVVTSVQLHSMFYNYYNWQLYYYPETQGLKNAQSLAATAEVMNWVIDIALYAALGLQVHIVCVTLRRTYKLAIMAACLLVALVSLGYRLYLAVFNIHNMILGINSVTEAQQRHLSRIAIHNNIIQICTIAFFSAVFVVKLAWAIHIRHKLNMKQFGPMQVIFVMGCQTLIVPLIFAILATYTLWGSQLQSMVPTVVAVFLPLSGMWASVQTDKARLVRSNNQGRQIPVGVSNNTYGSSGDRNAQRNGTATTSDTLIGSPAQIDDDKYSASNHHDRISDDDVELGLPVGRASSSGTNRPNQRGRSEHGYRYGAAHHGPVQTHELKNGDIVVDRTYSVRSD